jgi:hypothetical protein
LDKLRQENMKSQIEKAEMLAQIDLLKDRYMKVHGQKEEFKNELIQIKRKNIKINRKIQDFEIQRDDLINMVEGKNDFSTMRTMNPKDRAKILKERKKREREYLQKKMALGIDHIGESNALGLDKETKSPTYYQLLVSGISSFFDYLKPFKNDIKIIQSNYDRSINQFYKIL